MNDISARKYQCPSCGTIKRYDELDIRGVGALCVCNTMFNLDKHEVINAAHLKSPGDGCTPTTKKALAWLRKCQDIIIEKGAKYGDMQDTMHIFTDQSLVESLKHRIDQKLTRIKTMRESGVIDEEVQEIDLINYLVLKLALEKGYPDGRS